MLNESKEKIIIVPNSHTRKASGHITLQADERRSESKNCCTVRL